MCPELHIKDEMRDKSHFERNQEGKLFETLAVKKFGRSDAGKVMDDPQIIRTPEVLYLTMKYMRDCIVD